jgi:predicted Mrr-cat superfamily restriction endonuclease
MAVGDLVAYSSKQTRQVHLGRVTGEYVNAPEIYANYPHQGAIARRTDDWDKQPKLREDKFKTPPPGYRKLWRY